MKNKLLVCALLVVLLLSSMLCISCDDILGNLFLSEVTVTLDPNGGEGVDELTLVGEFRHAASQSRRLAVRCAL